LRTNSISIVIITKNAISTIADVIDASKRITTEIIVVDSGSTDGTYEKVSELGVTVLTITWQGFGAARNTGASGTKGDFILYLDSDEVPSASLISGLHRVKLEKDTVYGIKRCNFIGGKEVRYGDMGRDHVYRIHYRHNGKWNDDRVHERLEGQFGRRVNVPGHLNHYTTSSIAEYTKKLDNYAALWALEKAKGTKVVNQLKPVFSASFNFVRNYFLRLGILDGKLGWELAKLNAIYTFNKYKKLRRLLNGH
jgi:glycosyltransferase involved in cell wall biosynthesis